VNGSYDAATRLPLAEKATRWAPSTPDRRPIAALPTVDQIDELLPSELSALASALTALAAHVTLRLQTMVTDHGDDVETFDAEEAACRLGCSVDLLREHGAEWGVERVLIRDKNGTPTRKVYPRALVRAFLERGPLIASSATETVAA
jgi:hypothetical protein